MQNEKEMVSAVWNGFRLGTTDRCVIVGGVHYFPEECVKWEYLRPSENTTECPWKGTANYYDLEVDGSHLSLGAWRYANPHRGYEHIAGAIAFAPAVRIEQSGVDAGSGTVVGRHSGSGGESKQPAASTDRTSRAGSDESILAFLQRLPKCEVHLHLEAMIDAERLWTLITRNRELLSRVASREELLRSFQVRSLDDFINLFIGVIQPAIQSAEDLSLFVAAAGDYMLRNSIEYAEVHVAPTKLLQNGLAFADIVDVLDAESETMRDSKGLDLRFLIDVSRGFGLDNALRNLELTIANPRKSVVGIGLGGAESRGPAAAFAPVFERARAVGLHTTAHAGEALGPESIRAAIDVCHVERIGHGLSAMQDPHLIDELASRRIPVELCPASNVFTGAYVRSIAEHPIRAFFDAGVPVSLNTDDPVIFGVELIDEFMSAHEFHHFTPEELVRLNEYSIEMSFMEESKKVQLKSRGRTELERLL